MGKLRYHLFYICLILLFSAGPAAADRPTPPRPQSITVAVGSSFPPLCFLNHENKLEGFLIDLWRLWSRQTGVEVVFYKRPL